MVSIILHKCSTDIPPIQTLIVEKSHRILRRARATEITRFTFWKILDDSHGTLASKFETTRTRCVDDSRSGCITEKDLALSHNEYATTMLVAIASLSVAINGFPL